MKINARIVFIFLLICIVPLTIITSSVTVSGAISVEKLTELTSDSANECDPVWSPDGNDILFERNGEAYRVSSDGSGETKLTDTGGNAWDHSWSPDGSKILYTFLVDQLNCNIWVMNADGSSETRLTGFEDSPLQFGIHNYGTWSPSGSKIAYVASLDDIVAYVITMNADGSDKQIVAGPIDMCYIDYPAWSPDASKIAFETYPLDAERYIGVVNSDGSGLTIIPNGFLTSYTQSLQSQVWSPDGSKILYSSDESGNDDIYIINADGTGKTQLTADGDDEHDPRFSPDGSRILFVSGWGGNSDIWVMDADGSNKVQLTTDTACDSNPMWSPDGTKIAFNSDRNGNFDIWVMELSEESVEPPAPEIVSVSFEPQTGVYESETATISVTVKNNGGKSGEAYVTVSFPNDEEIISQGGSSDNVNTYPAGSEIWGRDGIIDSSEYTLVELYEPELETGQEETLTIEVKPNEGSEEIVFLVRAALKNDATGEYERTPASSDDLDQQGWYADKYSIAVYPDHSDLAQILDFTHTTGKVGPESTGEAVVTIENSGSTDRSFWVGLSYRKIYSNEWIDVPPAESAVLSPGESGDVEFSWTLTDEPGTYDIFTKIWDGYDSSSNLLLEPSFDERIDSEAFLVAGQSGFSGTINDIGITYPYDYEPHIFSYNITIDDLTLDTLGKMNEGDFAFVNCLFDSPAIRDEVEIGDEVEIYGECTDYDQYHNAYIIQLLSEEHYIRLIDTAPPLPEIIEVSYPEGISGSESATISVTVRNNGEKSGEGYVTVSLPNNEEIMSVSGTGNGYNELYPEGSSISGKDGQIESSAHPLGELQEFDWDTGQEETLTIEVKPNEGSEEIVFLVRAALKNDATGDYERAPASSDDLDQQGWYADKYSIEVLKDYVVTGDLTVIIEPSDVRPDARWRLTEGQDTGWHSSGDTIANIPTGNYEIQFNDVAGWNKPEDILIVVSSGPNSESGTYEEIPDENNPPEIVSVIADPAEVEAGGSSTVTVVASDPDGDPLTYSYEPSGGKIIGSGNAVTWTSDVAAPGDPPITETFYVNVAVDDGKEKVTSSVEVKVVPNPVEKYALIVGVNEYETSDDLDSPINNVNAIYNLLVNGYGYTPSSEKIQKLVDNDANKENFVDKLLYFEQTMDSNDVFILYFSGHGGRNDTTGEEYITLSDESSFSSNFINSELKDYDGTVLAIFDCCYSGGMAYETDIDTPSGTKNGIDGDNRIVLTSCEANEEGVDWSWSERTIFKDHTFFTSNLISAFTTARNEIVTVSGEKVSIEEAFSYAREKTIDDTKIIPLGSQHPRIMDNYPTKSDNKELCYLAEDPINPEFLAAIADCPVHLHAYDSEGRHTGVNVAGDGIEEEIPGSFYNGPSYDPEELILLGNSGNIRYEIKAFEEGVFNFTITKSTDKEITKITYDNISITSNSIATLIIGDSNPEHIMRIDDDGDGIDDRTKEPNENTVTESKDQESSDEDSSGDSSDDSSSSSTSSSGGGGGSSGGSGGGGGGGAGSPEPASNVEVKELSQEFVTNGNHVKFEFTRNVTCITYVDFDPKRTFSKVTTIVEMLKGKSAIVKDLPAGEVYRNINIWVGNEGMATPENIENAVVGFRVEKAWIEAGIDEASISLYRHNNEAWNELTTRKLGEDENYVYFEAETPGFSPFLIAAPGVENLQEEDQFPVPVEGFDGDKSEQGENESLEVEMAGPGITESGTKSKILMSIILLSILILVGYIVLKKQD